MRETVLAKRYAKALFKLAAERNVVDAVLREFDDLERTLAGSRDFRYFLFSRDINRKKKSHAVAALLENNVSPEFYHFMTVLLKKNREYIFPQIADEFRKFVDKFHHKIHASAITALPMDKEALSTLKAFLDARFQGDVQIDNQIDADVLGGIIVNVDGQVFDGSLRSQLLRLREQLRESPEAVTS